MRAVRVLFCAHRSWALQLLERLRQLPGHEFVHIGSPEDLTAERVRQIQPGIAFLPDWSWKVPQGVLSEVRCVGFHAAPLPEFRGGSPIQNQIARGIKQTRLTAFYVTKELDAGDILLDAPLSLTGSLNEIFGRVKRMQFRMIQKVLAGDFVPRPQTGTPTSFARRTPAMSELLDWDVPLEKIYDHIRMLTDPYPNAFVRLGGKRIVFKTARFDGTKITFSGEIRSES